MAEQDYKKIYWMRRLPPQHKWEIRIVPTGVFGLMVFLINLSIFLLGIFALTGLFPYISNSVGLVFSVLAVLLFIFVLCFKTDYVANK